MLYTNDEKHGSNLVLLSLALSKHLQTVSVDFMALKLATSPSSDSSVTDWLEPADWVTLLLSFTTDFTLADFIHLWSPHWRARGLSGAMCSTAFRAPALTSALKTISRVIDSRWLHHFVRQSWNNLKCFSEIKWNRRWATSSPRRDQLQMIITKWFQIIPNQLQPLQKTMQMLAPRLRSQSCPPQTAGRVLIVTGILARNNLLNSTTSTFYRFAARSTAHTF